MDQNFHDVELFFCFFRLSAFFPFSSLLFFFSFYIYLFSYNFPFDRSASMHAPVRSSHFSLSTYSDNTYLCNILFFMHGRMFEVFFSLYTCMVLFVYMCMLGAVLVRTFLFLFLFFFFLLSFFFFDGTLQ